MNLLGFIGDIFSPISALVSEFVEDKDKANEIKYKMFEIQSKAMSQALDYDKKLLDAKASIIRAEAEGDSWLQKSWRPVTMLVFLALVVLDSFGVLSSPLAPEAWTLLQIGLGGYVVGRSAEKLTDVLKKN